MSTTKETSWAGASGRQYDYSIFPISTQFRDVPGNYIYAKETTLNGWVPLYIGQTSSLRDRLESHEKEPCVTRHGATHIHVHTSSASENEREHEEIDLIKKHKPVCNEQHT